jgi:hypothetical protein
LTKCEGTTTFPTEFAARTRRRYTEGTNVVVLAPDVAEVFPDSIAVNEALRTLVRMSAKTVRAKAARKKRVG